MRLGWGIGVARPAPSARQVFTQRGFVAKLLLAKSDLADLQTLDTDLSKCLQDMGVGAAWWGRCPGCAVG